MNAAEIRETKENRNTIVFDAESNFWLREIAAQLAELVAQVQALETTVRIAATEPKRR